MVPLVPEAALRGARRPRSVARLLVFELRPGVVMTRPPAHLRKVPVPLLGMSDNLREGSAPMTDSGIHRLGLGTQVRLHSAHGAVDCGLLDIANVSTWSDLVDRVQRGWPVEVTGPQRNVFAPGAVLRAECLSDGETKR